jgi:hypothetical protein
VPNIRSQEVTNNSLTIVASDGRTFTVTKAEIQTFAAAQGGNAAARKAATIAWVLANMQTAIGAEQIPSALVTFDYDAANALAQLRLEVTSV